MALKRWLYKGGRPNLPAKLINAFWAGIHSLGVAPNYFVTLQVPGRQSGKLIRFPLAMVVVNNERYLVSMLGEDANWVRNLKAVDGRAVLVHGRTEQVSLQEVAVSERAPILKAYLKIAPGARPHITVDMNAPLADFESIAPHFPVFRVSNQPVEA